MKILLYFKHESKELSHHLNKSNPKDQHKRKYIRECRPRRRATRERDENIISRRNQSIRTNSKPELPINITSKAIAAKPTNIIGRDKFTNWLGAGGCHGLVNLTFDADGVISATRRAIGQLVSLSRLRQWGSIFYSIEIVSVAGAGPAVSRIARHSYTQRPLTCLALFSLCAWNIWTHLIKHIGHLLNLTERTKQKTVKGLGI